MQNLLMPITSAETVLEVKVSGGSAVLASGCVNSSHSVIVQLVAFGVDMYMVLPV